MADEVVSEEGEGIGEMNQIITGTVAKRADLIAMNEMGFLSLGLMETASSRVADYIKQKYADQKGNRVLILSGVGNNGADGIAVARMLLENGFDPEVWVIGNLEKASWEFLYQTVIYQQLDGLLFNFKPGDVLPDADICVDGIFGIGMHRTITGDFKNFIDEVNRHQYSEIVAIDVPSGIDTDTGELMGAGIRADVTITFGRNKTGLVTGEGKEYSGQILIVDIGIPDIAYQKAAEVQE